MTLWKITEKGPAKVKETKFKQEKLLEEHLENWIAMIPLCWENHSLFLVDK